MSLTVGDILERRSDLLELELVCGAEGLGRKIESPDISSPGLVLAGFTDRFPSGRLQVLGETEIAFLASLGDEERLASIETFYGFDVCAVFVTKGMTMMFVCVLLQRIGSMPVI